MHIHLLQIHRFSLSFSKKVFFQNTEDLNYFLQNKLICKSKSAVLPGSGVDLEKFKFSTTAVQKDKFVFLLISRLLRDKGIYEYIEAIRIIKRRYPEKPIEFQLLGEVGFNKSYIFTPSDPMATYINESVSAISFTAFVVSITFTKLGLTVLLTS